MKEKIGEGANQGARRGTRGQGTWSARRPRWVHATDHKVEIVTTMMVIIFVPSLFMEFTVSETFSYFGRLLGLTQETVERRR